MHEGVHILFTDSDHSCSSVQGRIGECGNQDTRMALAFQICVLLLVPGGQPSGFNSVQEYAEGGSGAMMSLEANVELDMLLNTTAVSPKMTVRRKGYTKVATTCPAVQKCEDTTLWASFSSLLVDGGLHDWSASSKDGLGHVSLVRQPWSCLRRIE